MARDVARKDHARLNVVVLEVLEQLRPVRVHEREGEPVAARVLHRQKERRPLHVLVEAVPVRAADLAEAR